MFSIQALEKLFIALFLITLGIASSKGSFHLPIEPFKAIGLVLTFLFLMNIKNNDKVVFFEDTAENLVTAKSLGWITVLIGNKRPMVSDVDFWFADINQALNYFHNCIVKNKH